MEFSYRLEKADWLAFTAHLRRQVCGAWLVRLWTRLAFLPFIAVLVFCARGDSQRTWGVVAVAVAIGIAWFFLYPRVVDDSAKRMTDRFLDDPQNANFFGTERVTLTPERLHTQDEDSELSLAWSRIIKTERTDDHIFLYVSRDRAIIIPRTSVQGATFAEVWNRIKEYMGERDGPT